MAQFIKCRFGPLDERRYTYIDPTGDISVGDFVKVPVPRHDEGWKRVEVMETGVEEPNFECKAILGKLDGQDVDEAIMRRAAVNAGDSQ